MSSELMSDRKMASATLFMKDRLGDSACDKRAWEGGKLGVKSTMWTCHGQ